MATKKKSGKTSTKSKKTGRKKASPKPKKAAKKAARKAASQKSTSRATKTSKPATKRAKKNSPRRRGRAAFSQKNPRSYSGEQSGDLQGLSRSQEADSESVEELLEEGNAFEGDAVLGVEDADNSDEKEVRTHEVPEDDVPPEYLDKE